MIGLILAGGLSERFGQDKAKAKWQTGSNETFLERALRVMRPHFSQVYVSCRPGQELNVDAPLLLDLQADSQGPAAGLLAAHSQLKEDVFVLACDYIYADKDCIEYLLAQWKPEAQALVFSNDQGFYEPLLGIWSAKALATIDQHRSRSPQQVLRELGIAKLQCPQGKWLYNVNTPEAVHS